MQTIKSLVLLCIVTFALGCVAEDLGAPVVSDAESHAAKPPKPPKPVKQSVDGRKLFDKTVTAAKINSEAASSGMVLTADGSGKAAWNSLGAGGVIASNVVGNVTGNVTGNLTGNVTGGVTGDVTGNLTGNVTGNVSGTAASVTGITSIAHGGTGSATQNFVDLTTNQTVAGNKTFSSTFNVSTCFTVESRPASTGGLNNFIGINAGAANVAGLGNTFVGHNSGTANVGGSSNTFMGLNAGSSNVSGNLNTYVGQGAGAFNNSGNNNNSFGQAAGFNNVSGNSNNNFGNHAGFANAANSNNTCIGDQAGAANTASGNTFVGASAGIANIGGANNVFVGSGAGATNQAGFQNSFLGINAGNKTTASHNAFFGAGSGQNNAGGDGNAAIGNVSGLSNTAGNNNAFLGGNTGSSNTIESFNTFVGDSSNGAAGITNATAVGSKASVTTSNSLVLGSISNVNGAGANADTLVGIGTTSPNSSLQVNGSLSLAYRPTNLIIDSFGPSDYMIISVTANASIGLPSTTGIKGRVYLLKTTATTKLFTSSGETIDNINYSVVPLSLPANSVYTVITDGVGHWYRIN